MSFQLDPKKDLAMLNRPATTFAASAFGLTLALGAAGAQATNLVTNGSFENLTNGYGQIGYNTNATGWTTSGYNFVFNSTNVQSTSGVQGSDGTLSLWGSGNGGLSTITASPAGGNFIGADGAYEIGAISQTVTGLTAGAQYSVSFYVAAGQQSGFTGPTTDYWTVGLGNTALTSNTQAGSQSTPIINLASHSFSGWQYESLTFTATGTSDVLSFLATGTPSGVPPFALLDGVDMEATGNFVPEPDSMGLMVGGVAVLAGFAWRRRKAMLSA
jgi:hypothetical protein